MKNKILTLAVLLSSFCTLAFSDDVVRVLTNAFPETPKVLTINADDIASISHEHKTSNLSAEELLMLLKSDPDSIAKMMYPMESNAWAQELLGDNLVDNNLVVKNYHKNAYSTYDDDYYQFRTTKDVKQANRSDSPQSIWRTLYGSILHCNQVIELIDNIRTTGETGYDSNILEQLRNEAVLCRAWIHFNLATLFAPEWRDAAISAQEKCLPYVTTSQDEISVAKDSKSVNEFYNLIEQDLLSALPKITDGGSQFRFNAKAANTFAARLYLQKRDWAKVKQYANAALGNNTDEIMRVWTDGETASDKRDSYLASKSNYLIQDTYSLRWRHLISGRYTINDGRSITSADGTIYNIPSPLKACLWGKGPVWTSYLPFYSGKIYVSGQGQEYGLYPIYFMEYFEYTDTELGIGYVHSYYTPFTAEETLLMRAESEFHLGNYQAVLNDLNIWTNGKGCTQELTYNKIGLFYTDTNTDFITNINPQSVNSGFSIPNIDLGGCTTEQLLQCLLHFRRIETLGNGLRWLDLKRYGVKVEHYMMDQNYNIKSITASTNAGVTEASYEIEPPYDDVSDNTYAYSITTKSGETISIPYDSKILFGLDEDELDAQNSQYDNILTQGKNGFALYEFNGFESNMQSVANLQNLGVGYLYNPDANDTYRIKSTNDELIVAENDYDSSFCVLAPLSEGRQYADYQRACKESLYGSLPFSKYFVENQQGDVTDIITTDGGIVTHSATYTMLSSLPTPQGILIYNTRSRNGSTLLNLKLDRETNQLTDGSVTLVPDVQGTFAGSFVQSITFDINQDNNWYSTIVAALDEAVKQFNSTYSLNSISIAPSTNNSYTSSITVSINKSSGGTLKFGIYGNMEVNPYNSSAFVFSVPGLENGTFTGDSNYKQICKKSPELPSVMSSLAQKLVGAYSAVALTPEIRDYQQRYQDDNGETQTVTGRKLSTFHGTLEKADGVKLEF